MAPSPGSFYEGTNEFHVGAANARAFLRQDDVELVYFAVCTESRLPIESIDRDKGILRTRLRSALDASALDFSSTYYHDNVLEELHEAGQWYLDRAQGRLSRSRHAPHRILEVDLHGARAHPRRGSVRSTPDRRP